MVSATYGHPLANLSLRHYTYNSSPHLVFMRRVGYRVVLQLYSIWQNTTQSSSITKHVYNFWHISNSPRCIWPCPWPHRSWRWLLPLQRGARWWHVGASWWCAAWFTKLLHLYGKWCQRGGPGDINVDNIRELIALMENHRIYSSRDSLGFWMHFFRSQDLPGCM